MRAESLAADAGENAALAGKHRDSNPYPLESELHVWWDFGWLSITDEEKEAIRRWQDDKENPN